MYEFWYDYVKPKYVKEQNFETWIRYLDSLHKSRRHLLRHFKRC